MTRALSPSRMAGYCAVVVAVEPLFDEVDVFFEDIRRPPRRNTPAVAPQNRPVCPCFRTSSPLVVVRHRVAGFAPINGRLAPSPSQCGNDARSPTPQQRVTHAASFLPPRQEPTPLWKSARSCRPGGIRPAGIRRDNAGLSLFIRPQRREVNRTRTAPSADGGGAEGRSARRAIGDDELLRRLRIWARRHDAVAERRLQRCAARATTGRGSARALAGRRCRFRCASSSRRRRPPPQRGESTDSPRSTWPARPSTSSTLRRM